MPFIALMSSAYAEWFAIRTKKARLRNMQHLGCIFLFLRVYYRQATWRLPVDRRSKKQVVSKEENPLSIPDRIERIEILPVSRERVWDAITRPEQMSQWLPMVRAMDFRVGGEITFTWENERSPYPGRIEVIEPGRRFAFRWYSHAIGHPELKLAPHAGTLVEFTLEEVSEGTKLTLVESGFASLPDVAVAEQSYQDNQGGWSALLPGLRAFVLDQVSAM
jgi:uncharacterized protein YndB with AHSA1/START domain